MPASAVQAHDATLEGLGGVASISTICRTAPTVQAQHSLSLCAGKAEEPEHNATVSPTELPGEALSGGSTIPEPMSSSAATKEEEREAAPGNGGHKGVLTPLTWSKLKFLIDSHTDNIDRYLGRRHEDQLVYLEHLKRVRNKYGSVANYLTSHALADLMEPTRSPTFDASASLEPDDIRVIPNNFPYFLADAAEHWVMWSRKPLEPGFNPPPIVLDIIRDKFGPSIEWRYMVHPPALQSVKELYHAHIFVKRL